MNLLKVSEPSVATGETFQFAVSTPFAIRLGTWKALEVLVVFSRKVSRKVFAILEFPVALLAFKTRVMLSPVCCELMLLLEEFRRVAVTTAVGRVCR